MGNLRGAEGLSGIVEGALVGTAGAPVMAGGGTHGAVVLGGEREAASMVKEPDADTRTIVPPPSPIAMSIQAARELHTGGGLRLRSVLQRRSDFSTPFIRKYLKHGVDPPEAAASPVVLFPEITG